MNSSADMQVDLRAMAGQIAAKNALNQAERARETYTFLRRKYGGASDVTEAKFVENYLLRQQRADFLRDNFPEGKHFKLLGVDCLCESVSPGHGLEGPRVQYLTKSESGGLTTRELTLAQALTVVLGDGITPS